MNSTYNSNINNINSEAVYLNARYTLKIRMDSDMPDYCIAHYMNYNNRLNGAMIGDAGLDLITPYDTERINIFKVTTIDLKFRGHMIDNITGQDVSYYLYPRSSIVKTCFQLVNSVGIIDAGYRGNIKAVVRSFEDDAIVKHMTKLFQICAPDLSQFRVQLVDSLTETVRGDGGFGSTDRTNNN